MVIFIASESMFFAGLFAAYYTLRSIDHPWPSPGVHLDMAEGIAMTVILVLSSVPAHLASVSLRRQDFGAMQRWLTVTVLMGAVFLGLKVHDWYSSGITIATDAYGSLFFGLTGFHALHMLVGLVMLSGVTVKGALGGYRGGRHAQAGAEATVYYWHFVDAIWLGVFTTIWLVR